MRIRLRHEYRKTVWQKLSMNVFAMPTIAVPGRYNQNPFFGVLPVPYRALQSDRCLVITT